MDVYLDSKFFVLVGTLISCLNVKSYGGDGQDPEPRSKDINSIPLADFKSQLYISLILSLNTRNHYILQSFVYEYMLKIS